jgi:hypothetical protein
VQTFIRRGRAGGYSPRSKVQFLGPEATYTIDEEINMALSAQRSNIGQSVQAAGGGLVMDHGDMGQIPPMLKISLNRR